MANLQFLYHPASEGDLKLFFAVWITFYCVIHLIWEGRMMGLSRGSLRDKQGVVADAVTLATGLILLSSVVYSDVFKLVGEVGLAVPLLTTAIVSILVGLAGLPPKNKLDLLKERLIRGEITGADYDTQKGHV